MDGNRQLVLAGLLLGFAALAAIVLAAVLETVVFAITVAYVLYPIKRWLYRRGVSDRLSSGAATLMAFLAVALILIPLGYSGYQRREEFIQVIRTLPESFSLAYSGVDIEVETEPVIDAVVSTFRNIAVDLAVAAPSLLLELALFTILLYGLLYKPRELRRAVFAAVPDSYHDIVSRLHGTTKTTLYSLYVLQAATALATFVIGLVLFAVMGYSSPMTLALIAGILQFVPILGPSILVVGLGVNDFLIGNPQRGVAILTLGLLFIAFTPDALIRTKLAGFTGQISSTLYFIGFVGGILSIGALGIIIGPLVVALLVESVNLLAEWHDRPSDSDGYSGNSSETGGETPSETSNTTPSD